MKLTKELRNLIIDEVSISDPTTTEKWFTKDLHQLDSMSNSISEVATFRIQVKVDDEEGEGQWEEARVLVIHKDAKYKIKQYNPFTGDMLFDVLSDFADRYNW